MCPILVPCYVRTVRALAPHVRQTHTGQPGFPCAARGLDSRHMPGPKNESVCCLQARSHRVCTRIIFPSGVIAFFSHPPFYLSFSQSSLYLCLSVLFIRVTLAIFSCARSQPRSSLPTLPSSLSFSSICNQQARTMQTIACLHARSITNPGKHRMLCRFCYQNSCEHSTHIKHNRHT